MTTPTTLSAEELTARGYRRVSRKYRLVARIDREDWLSALAIELHRSPAEFYVNGERKPAPIWCDHYRRCHSQDVLRVADESEFLRVPGSGDEECWYIPQQ